MSRLHLNFEGTLPDDHLHAAKVMANIADARDEFVAKLHDAGFVHEHSLKIAKPKQTRGPRKRKPQAVAAE